MLHMEHGGWVITVRLPPCGYFCRYGYIFCHRCGNVFPERTKHGGANIKVMQMMNDIRENVHDWSDRDEVKSYLGKMLDGQVFDTESVWYSGIQAVPEDISREQARDMLGLEQEKIFSAGGRKYGNKSNRAYPGTFAGNAKQKGKSCGHLWKQPKVKEKASAEI